MRRGLVVGVHTALLLLAMASPALSHATFPGQGPLAAQADQTLNMAVPEERDPDIHNVGVKLQVPASWTATHCQATVPWHCTITGNPAQIQWTKDAGAPPGPDDVAFVFTVHTGGPGTYPVPVDQTYSTQEVVHWIGPPDSGEPAPVLTVSAPAASPSAPPPPPTVPAPALSKPAAAPAPASPHPAASTAHPATPPSPPPSSPPPSATPKATETANPSSTPSSTTTVISAPNDASGSKTSGGEAPLIIGALLVAALFGVGLAVLRRRRAQG